MNETNIKNKLAFIDWYLLNHKPSSEKGNWCLSTIKRSDLIDRVYFTNDIKSKKFSMIVTSSDYEYNDGPDFVCYMDGMEVEYREFIVYLVKNKYEELYIQLKFFRHKKCTRLKELLSDIENANLSFMIDLFMESLILKEKLKKLNVEIDDSLDKGLKERFMELCIEKKELVERINSLM